MSYKLFYFNPLLFLSICFCSYEHEGEYTKDSIIWSIKQGYSNENLAKTIGCNVGLRIKEEYSDLLFFDVKIDLYKERSVSVNFGDLSKVRFVDLGDVSFSAKESRIRLNLFNDSVESLAISNSKIIPSANSIMIPMEGENLKSSYAFMWNYLTSHYTISGKDGKKKKISGNDRWETLPAFTKLYDEIWPQYLDDASGAEVKVNLRDNIIHHGEKSKIDAINSFKTILGSVFNAASAVRNASEQVAAGAHIQYHTLTALKEKVDKIIDLIEKPGRSKVTYTDFNAALLSAMTYLTNHKIIDISKSPGLEAELKSAGVGLPEYTSSALKKTFTHIINKYQVGSIDISLSTFLDLIGKTSSPAKLTASDLSKLKLLEFIMPLIDQNDIDAYIKNLESLPAFREPKFMDLSISNPNDPNYRGPDYETYNNISKQHDAIKGELKIFKDFYGTRTESNIERVIFYKMVKGLFNYIYNNPVVRINQTTLNKTNVPFLETIDYIKDSTLLEEYKNMVSPLFIHSDDIVIRLGNIIDNLQSLNLIGGSVKDSDDFKIIEKSINDEISTLEYNTLIELSFSKSIGFSLDSFNGLEVSGKSLMFSFGKSIKLPVKNTPINKKNLITCESVFDKKSKTIVQNELYENNNLDDSIDIDEDNNSNYNKDYPINSEKQSHINIGIGGIFLEESYSSAYSSEYSQYSLFNITTNDVGLGFIFGLDVFDSDNKLNINPELGIMMSVVGLSKVKGSEFDPSFPDRKDLSTTYKSIERQVIKPIIKFSLPISIKISNNVFINIEFSKLIVARMFKSTYKFRIIKSLILENRKGDSIGIGITFIY